MTLASRLVRALLGAGLGLCAVLSFAQGGGAMVEVPQASALDCLFAGPPGAVPAYPETERKLRRHAVVRVRLSFDRPDAPPAVQEFHNSGSEAFSEVVARHVRQYRLPCLPVGAAKVVATQEFRFDPTDGRKVVCAEPRAEATGPSRLTCLASASGKFDYSTLIDASRRIRGRAPDGNVIVDLKFTDATSAPQMTVVYDGSGGALASIVKRAVDGYRLPCMQPAEAAVVGRQVFSFLLDDRTQYALNDLPLQRFLGAVEALDKQRVRFDFATMGCPFDVRFAPIQPHAPNGVGELDRADPNRREFLEWLRGLVFKVPPQGARFVMGQQMTVSVPCGVLDLS